MNPVTIDITIDLDAHLSRYRGYDQDGEAVEEPQTFEDVILHEAARIVADRAVGDGTREMASWVRTRAKEALALQVDAMIAEQLGETIQRTDTWGGPRGEPTTLRDEITKEALEYLRKPSQSVGRSTLNPVQAFVRAEVERAVKAELQGALDEARAQVRSAVVVQAASLIGDTIAAATGVKL